MSALSSHYTWHFLRLPCMPAPRIGDSLVNSTCAEWLCLWLSQRSSWPPSADSPDLQRSCPFAHSFSGLLPPSSRGVDPEPRPSTLPAISPDQDQTFCRQKTSTIAIHIHPSEPQCCPNVAFPASDQIYAHLQIVPLSSTLWPRLLAQPRSPPIRVCPTGE